MDKPDLKKLPDYVKGHQTYRALVETDSDNDPITLEYPNAVPDKPENSNLIGSYAETYPYSKVRVHRPLIDLDFPAHLIPSTTPGHNHLYVDAFIPEESYEKMLEGLTSAGLVQQGFLTSFKRNRQTTLRLPGVKKCGEFETKIAASLGAALLTEGKSYRELLAMKGAIEQAIKDRLDGDF